MGTFKTLFKMQLKEKMDLSYLKNPKQCLFKIVFSILGFVAVTAVAYVLLFLCQFLNLFSILNHIPISVMSFILFIIFIFDVISCTLSLTHSLYVSKDNQVLITYPANPNMLFLSKLLVNFFAQLKKTFNFTIAIFLAYGILSGLPILYYIWMPVMFTLYTAFVVLLSGMLSIPTIYIKTFLNRFNFIKIILISILLAAVVYGVVKIVLLIPEDINLIRSWTKVSIWLRNFFQVFTTYFVPFYLFTVFICGTYTNMQVKLFTPYSYKVLIVLVLCIALLVLVNYFLSRPFYLRAISKHFEFSTTKHKHQKNKGLKPINSIANYETKKMIRLDSLLSTTLSILIIAPLAVLILNKIYSAINTRIMGDYLTIAFNILIILLFVVMHNVNVASIYSRDGDGLLIYKTMPQNAFKLMFARLVYNFVSTVLILTVTVPIFLYFTNLSIIEGILIYLSCLFVTSTHIVASAEFDFLKPKISLYNEEGSVAVNPNEAKSLILALGIALVTFLFILFFLLKDSVGIWVKLFFVSLAIFIVKLVLFKIKVNTLFREM